MDIAQTASTALAAAPAAERPRQIITSDFDTFLKLLTTQIRNQDPLN
ncbi:MAG: flagellar basal body rod modification protein, partial [Alphaproteobacteria bacterium HGW-Alphaproteobacteria-2]